MRHQAKALVACGVREQSGDWQTSWRQGNLRDNKTLNLSIHSPQTLAAILTTWVESTPRGKAMKAAAGS